MNRYDVNFDGYATPNDALIVINDLNKNGPRSLPNPPANPPPYLDTNADNEVNSFDVLVVINHLNAVPATQAEENYTYLSDGRIDTVTVTTGRANNLITDYDYYPEGPTSFDSGRLMSVTYADGSDKPSTVSYAYALNADRGSTTTVTEFSGTLERVTKYRYDALDRLVAILGADPDTTGPGKITPHAVSIRYVWECHRDRAIQS